MKTRTFLSLLGILALAYSLFTVADAVKTRVITHSNALLTEEN